MPIFVRASRRAKSYIRRAATLGSMLTRSGKRESMRRGMIHTGRPRGVKANREVAVFHEYMRSASKLKLKRAEGRRLLGRRKSVDKFNPYTMRIGKYSSTYTRGRIG